MCVSNIRKRLLPDQEKNLLFLMRSANDSASDVAIYNSRAHGYLPKTPLKGQKGIREILAPIWTQKFPKLNFASQEDSKDYMQDTDMASLFEDIKVNISDMDKWVSSQEGGIGNDWSTALEKLQLLKQNLLAVHGNEMVLVALTAIDNLRGSEPTKRLEEEWKEIRSSIELAIC